jgi:hypothetical protein
MLPILAALGFALLAWGYARIRRFIVMRGLLNTVAAVSASTRGVSLGPLSPCVNMWWAVQHKGDEGLGQDEIDVAVHELDVFTPSERLAKYIDGTWTKALETATWNNEARWGLASYSLVGKRPRLSFWQTDYRNFIGTNRQVPCSDIASHLPEQGRALSQLLHDPQGYEFLAESGLSLDLATALLVTTEDNYVLLSRRSNGLLVLPGVVHASVAEGTRADVDHTQGVPDPFKTLSRGAVEELGIPVPAHLIRIIGIGLYRPWAQPCILARYRYPGTAEAALGDLCPEDRSSEGSVFAVKLTPAALFPFLFDRSAWGVDMTTAELCKAALALALVQEMGQKTAASRIRRALYSFEEFGPPAR